MLWRGLGRGLVASLALACAAAGCKTGGGMNWDKEVGVATYADAVSRLGQPVREGELSDGSIVTQWLYQRGEDRLANKILYGSGPSDIKDGPRMSDKYLNMTFGPDRKLKSWRWSYK